MKWIDESRSNRTVYKVPLDFVVVYFGLNSCYHTKDSCIRGDAVLYLVQFWMKLHIFWPRISIPTPNHAIENCELLSL